MRGVIMLLPVLIWTLICALFGILIRVFLRADQTVKCIGHYLWSPVILFLFGIKVKVVGRENLPAIPAIFVANHTSQLDIPIMSLSIPRGLFFVAKKELASIPILGQYMHIMGMIFVDRGNKEKAIQSMEIAAKKVKKGKNLVTFPEGTRGDGQTLLPFKKGSFVIAQKGGIPLVPVAIHRAHIALPKGRFIVSPIVIEVNILDPITPQIHQHWTILRFTQEAKEKIAAALSKERQ
jgi:1-acyl-sn-glycerol-3-phosphate acyltransferase